MKYIISIQMANRQILYYQYEGIFSDRTTGHYEANIMELPAIIGFCFQLDGCQKIIIEKKYKREVKNDTL